MVLAVCKREGASTVAIGYDFFFLSPSDQGYTNFSKLHEPHQYSRHQNVIKSNFHTEVPQILGATVQNLGCSWLRHCATNRKVAGSIPDGVIGIFP
jgi:hypothetical protein